MTDALCRAAARARFGRPGDVAQGARSLETSSVPFSGACGPALVLGAVPRLRLAALIPQAAGSDDRTYDLFQKGRSTCGAGAAQATVSLEKAKRREPQSRSIREALGIAYFRLRRWEEAEAEFRGSRRALAGGRVRAPRARARTREAGKAQGGHTALQARTIVAPASCLRRGIAVGARLASPARARAVAPHDETRPRLRRRGLVRRQCARGALARLRPARRSLRLRGQAAVSAVRHQPQHPATGRADVDLPPREPPGGIPRARGRVSPDHRGRGMAAPGVGLLPLPRRDGPCAHRRRGRPLGRARRRRARRAKGHRVPRRQGRARARRRRAEGDDEVRRGVRRFPDRGAARTAKAGCPTSRRSSRRPRGEPRRRGRPSSQSSTAAYSNRHVPDDPGAVLEQELEAYLATPRSRATSDAVVMPSRQSSTAASATVRIPASAATRSISSRRAPAATACRTSSVSGSDSDTRSQPLYPVPSHAAHPLARASSRRPLSSGGRLEDAQLVEGRVRGRPALEADPAHAAARRDARERLRERLMLGPELEKAAGRLAWHCPRRAS